MIKKYYDLSNGTAGYRQIKDQLEEHEGLIITYYMSYILKCKIMKLPEVRKKRRIKENIQLPQKKMKKNILMKMWLKI